MKRVLILTAAAGLMGACSPEPGAEAGGGPGGGAVAAADVGVCYRVRAGARELLDRVNNLPTCAQRLEAVRMMEGAPTEGVFEGRTISVTEAEITQGRPGGQRYPVFTTGQRRDMQAAIQALLDRRAENGRSS